MFLLKPPKRAVKGKMVLRPDGPALHETRHTQKALFFSYSRLMPACVLVSSHLCSLSEKREETKEQHFVSNTQPDALIRFKSFLLKIYHIYQSFMAGQPTLENVSFGLLLF